MTEDARRTRAASLARRKPSGKRIRRLLTTITVTGVVVSASLLVAHAATAALPTPQVTTIALPAPTLAAASVTAPDLGGLAIAADGYGTLLAHDADTPRPIASITKIVTALTLLEAHPLRDGEPGPSITFTQADEALLHEAIAAGGSRAPVQSGLTLTMRQALEAMLLPSANNYATSLANWGFGSVPAFLEHARTWLKAHELGNIVINDATGMDARNVASPADLIRLGKLALANPALASIVREATADVPGVGTLENTNKLLAGGVLTGIKTGTGDGANASNLLFSFQVNKGTIVVPVVGVVLGAASHDVIDAALPALISQITDGFQSVELVKAGQPVAQVVTAWGQRLTLRTASGSSAIVWGNPKVTLNPKFDALRAASQSQQVGAVTIAIDGGTPPGAQLSVPIAADAPVGQPDLWWRLTHLTELG
ncbi:MAG TPA: serine hydrolase [Candidatus Lumbricidophila sp.]|nr:serine hydrolase [Candidatus Lumbricidophila sp.]